MKTHEKDISGPMSKFLTWPPDKKTGLGLHIEDAEIGDRVLITKDGVTVELEVSYIWTDRHDRVLLSVL